MPILYPGHVTARRLAALAGHRQGVYALALGQQGRTLLSAGQDGQLVRWQLSSADMPGALVAKLAASCYALSWQADGLLAIAQNQQGILWLRPSQEGGLQEAGSLALGPVAVFSLTDTQHGLLATLADGRTMLADPTTRRITGQAHHSTQAARCAALLADDLVAVGYSDGQVRLLALPSLGEVAAWRAHAPSVFTLLAMGSGRLLSGGRDARLRLWQVDDGRELAQVPAHHGTINQLASSADGALIASASADKTLKIWRADDLVLLKVLDQPRHGGHTASVNCCIFLPSDAGSYQLASGGDDRQVCVWEVGGNE